LREIAQLMEAREQREQRADWYTARIVAMVAAVRSKRGKYDPVKYMMNAKEIRAKAQREREPMTGDEILAKLKAIGYPVLDMRGKS
jgi:hypothetical protein